MLLLWKHFQSMTMRELKNEFEVNDIGEPKMIIEVEIHWDQESWSLTISQKNYVWIVFECFGLMQVNPVAMASVATVATDVFQINWFSMRSKIAKITKIFGKIEDPENRGVI